MAWIAPVAGAVASLWSAYQSNRQGKKALSAQNQALKNQQDIIKQTMPYGQHFLQESQNAITPAQRYYSSLLNGNRYQMQETLAPELNSMAERYAGSVANSRSQYARGGMNTARAQDVPFQYNAAASNAMFGARRDAAGQLANLGNQEAGLGLGAFGLGNSAASGNLDAAMRMRQIASQQSEQAGSGFFSAINQLGNYYSSRQSAPSNLPQGTNYTGHNLTPGYTDPYMPKTTYTQQTSNPYQGQTSSNSGYPGAYGSYYGGLP